MRLKWWEIGLSAALLLHLLISINCTFDPSGIPGEQIMQGGLPNAYQCNCACADPSDFTNANLRVCAPPGLNPNLGGTFDQAAANADCETRVSQTFAGLEQIVLGRGSRRQL